MRYTCLHVLKTPANAEYFLTEKCAFRYNWELTDSIIGRKAAWSRKRLE